MEASVLQESGWVCQLPVADVSDVIAVGVELGSEPDQPHPDEVRSPLMRLLSADDTSRVIGAFGDDPFPNRVSASSSIHDTEPSS
jgi:hypothetical protein